MTCEQWREEYDLYLGQTELPADLQAHLATCEACRTYVEQMNALASSLGDDSLFDANVFETNRVVCQVEDAIAEKEQPAPSFVWRFRFIAAAAVIVLAVAVGVNQYRDGAMVERTTSSDSISLAALDTNPLVSDSVQVSTAELEKMLFDYSSQNSDAADELLQNLTEEEIRYLEKNFDVGELL